MPSGTFDNVIIRGIACAVPENEVDNISYYQQFGQENVDKFIKMTNVKKRHISLDNQTSSDLAYVAANRLLEHLEWKKDSIDGLIFITQTPDYRFPATACVLHKRLELKTECLAFDVNLGCSGYVYGLHLAASLLQTGDIRRILLLVGDTINKSISPFDKSTAMLFGDAGAATALEKSDDYSEINYLLKTKGEGFKSIITPSGAYRNMNGKTERIESSEGILRSDFDLYMNGTDVFNFTISDVPDTFKEFVEKHKISLSEVDYFIFHQANFFMLKTIAKMIGIPIDKLPISIDRFGNTSVSSIPLTLCDRCNNSNKYDINVIMTGFGIGLSWGIISANVCVKNCLPIIYTSDYYKDGGFVI